MLKAGEQNKNHQLLLLSFRSTFVKCGRAKRSFHHLKKAIPTPHGRKLDKILSVVLNLWPGKRQARHVVGQATPESLHDTYRM